MKGLKRCSVSNMSAIISIMSISNIKSVPPVSLCVTLGPFIDCALYCEALLKVLQFIWLIGLEHSDLCARCSPNISFASSVYRVTNIDFRIIEYLFYLTFLYFFILFNFHDVFFVCLFVFILLVLAANAF